MTDITCPSCNTEFEAEDWESGDCPGCGKAYWWEEMCTEDYSDCWSYVEWEQYNESNSTKLCCMR